MDSAAADEARAKLLPLDGVTVVSIEHAIAAPFATRQLADLGARVIKIERPGVGDFAREYDDRVNGMASHFVWCNRGKESLTLDLKSPSAAGILHELVTGCDVFVQNLAPGAAARLGLSERDLRPEHPRIIICDISGYGSDGPYRDRKAYDLMIQSEAGLLSVTGTQTEPVKVGVSIADIAAGMYAFTGILSALILRDRTGVGSQLDISMLESLGEWMGFPLYYAYGGGEPPPRTGANHATIFPYGSFAAGDGRNVLLGLQNEREWAIFCERVLVRPELALDERFHSNVNRVRNRAELTAEITQAFASLTADEVVAKLDAAGIANARIRTIDEVWAHPQLAARERWSPVGTPAGEIQMLIPPMLPQGAPNRPNSVPALGEHSEAILRELGRTDAEILALRRAGAV